jgi:DNA mismatch endonuclease, patch repair protein
MPPSPGTTKFRPGVKEERALRSRIMRAVKGRDTSPEWTVRRLAHELGYRYRLHRSDLPGKPDLAFIGRRKVVFVHGCFWHGHQCRRGARTPKANRAYWQSKIARNKERDGRNIAALKAMDWRVLTVWECELKSRARVAARLKRFLGQ